MSDLIRKAAQTPIINQADQADSSAPVGQGSAQPLVIGDAHQVPGAQKCLPPPPSTKALNADQLREVAGVGGVGIRGTGELTGRLKMVSQRVVNFGIATQEEVPMLITANPGSRSEVKFELDITAAKAKAMAGQDVSVSGTIDKTSDWNGKITGAKIEASDGFPYGTWKSFSGTVDNITGGVGSSGEPMPQGSYLRLDNPINVGGINVKFVLIDNREMQNGDHVDLTGRLDPRTWGGSTPETKYVALTGVTNQTAGEPSYDGQTFRGATGKPLEVQSYNVPNMYDGPSTLYVLDQGADKAWIGKRGVFMPPHLNNFLGFRSSRAIENPTAQDRAAVDTNAAGKLVDRASGDELELLGKSGQGPGVADGMETSWYRNPGSGDVYRFQNGGISGFRNQMEQIIREPAQNGLPI